MSFFKANILNVERGISRAIVFQKFYTFLLCFILRRSFMKYQNLHMNFAELDETLNNFFI